MLGYLKTRTLVHRHTMLRPYLSLGHIAEAIPPLGPRKTILQLLRETRIDVAVGSDKEEAKKENAGDNVVMEKEKEIKEKMAKTIDDAKEEPIWIGFDELPK